MEVAPPTPQPMRRSISTNAKLEIKLPPKVNLDLLMETWPNTFFKSAGKAIGPAIVFAGAVLLFINYRGTVNGCSLLPFGPHYGCKNYDSVNMTSLAGVGVYLAYNLVKAYRFLPPREKLIADEIHDFFKKKVTKVPSTQNGLGIAHKQCLSKLKRSPRTDFNKILREQVISSQASCRSAFAAG